MIAVEENRRNKVLLYNEELIKKYGLDVYFSFLSDPLNPSPLEEQYIIQTIVTKRESCTDICRRLGCSYERIRLKVRRQKSNPMKIIKRSSGRPSKAEIEAPTLGDNPRLTIQWAHSVRKFYFVNIMLVYSTVI
jgi:hypothetical protein